jgi:hypothetical protein
MRGRTERIENSRILVWQRRRRNDDLNEKLASEPASAASAAPLANSKAHDNREYDEPIRTDAQGEGRHEIVI